MKEHCSLVVLLICNLAVADDSQSVPATTTDPAADEILANCGGTIAVFIGATYLRAEVDIAGEIEFETPGGPAGVTNRF